MKAHLHRCHSDTQGFGGLLNIAVFQFAENEYFAVGKRQSDEGLADKAANFFAFKGLGGDFAPVGEKFGSYFAFAIIVEGVRESGLCAAESAAGLVEDDADEPCAETSFGPEAAEVAVGLEKGLLDRKSVV